MPAADQDHPVLPMARAESTVVGLVLAVVCPATLFVTSWWTAAALSIYDVLPLGTGGIIVAAFAGLGLGVVLDVVFLKTWVFRFYRADAKVLVPTYLAWSVMAVGLCMGLPVGNVVLGTMAGVYVGRRHRHAESNRETLRLVSRNAGLFTATATGLEALPIGLLALQHERYIAEAALEAVGMDQLDVGGPAGVALVAALCLVLMVVQFSGTYAAATLSYGSDRWRPGTAHL